MLVYSMVVHWYLTEGHAIAQKLPARPDPWYRKTARPSFRDMLAALRRASWAGALLDLPSDRHARQKILANYVDRVVAIA